ncbi:MAG: hypothetical protein WCG47_16715 [Dermatophilaceae bacterium]
MASQLRQDAQVELLLEQGWRPPDVALITTGRRDPVQVGRAGDSDQEEYWSSGFV